MKEMQTCVFSWANAHGLPWHRLHHLKKIIRRPSGAEEARRDYTIILGALLKDGQTAQVEKPSVGLKRVQFECSWCCVFWLVATSLDLAVAPFYRYSA